MLPGEVPSWTPNGIKRQWFTRLEYLSRSPYEVTPDHLSRSPYEVTLRFVERREPPEKIG